MRDASLAVVILEYMTPSIATTGANAHCPKQATVRTVKRRSAVVKVVSESTLKPSAPKREAASASKAREPLVWQAVPRQTTMECSP